MRLLALLLISVCLCFTAHAGYKVQMVRKANGATKVLSVQKIKTNVPQRQSKLLRSLPYHLDEGPNSSPDFFQEYIMNEADMTPGLLNLNQMRDEVNWPGSEVKALVVQGPTNNRINLTIVGDGYISSEKDKFFTDAQRATEWLFKGQTFASYLPLFNVYAVFVPSNESGIGDGYPKDTALRLYRNPKGSKRAIMPGDEGAAERALALSPATDYPILIANDNYYGGLGGRYAISTSSVRSGMIVLRHELGHNFGSVGEEYDGGYVYSGANSSSSSDVRWSRWADAGLKINDAVNLGGEYMWQNLSGKPANMSFRFPGANNGVPYLLQILMSSVGWETPEDVTASLDGTKIPLNGTFNDDRNFHELGPVAGFPAGNHTINFTENVHDGDNVLAFVRIYAMPQDYDFTQNKIGAYATFDASGRKTWRPTHDSCLMRNMLRPNFCVVDQENMWIRFLDRVDLIDEVAVTPASSERKPGRAAKVVTLKATPLPGLQIAWFKLENGKEVELTQLHNQLSWKAEGEATGKFRVKTRFVTPEVRTYTKRFSSEKDFSL